MKDNMNGKVMVITGASSGIGRATAIEFTRQGGTVVLASRSKEVLEKVAAACSGGEERSLVITTDVTKEEEVNRLAEETVRRFGKIDVWVNNASVSIFGAFKDIPTEDIRQVIDINLFGNIYGSRAAVRQFTDQGWGTLINLASIAGVIGQAYSTPYSISKFGIRGLGISLGQELSNKKNIHICTVLPGVIDTPIYQQSANYTGKAINPAESAVKAHKVARTIIGLINKPRKEVYVGKSTTQMRLGRLIAPVLFDKMVRKIITTIELVDNKAVPPNSGNLYHPQPQLESISGGWIKKEKEGKRVTLRGIVGKAAVAAGFVVGVGLLFIKR